MKTDNSSIPQKLICPDPADVAAFLRDELETIEQKTIEKHIEACPSCQKLASELNSTILELKNCPLTYKSSTDLTDQILEKIPFDTSVHPAALRFPGKASLQPVLRIAAGFIILVTAAIVVLFLRNAYNNSSDNALALFGQKKVSTDFMNQFPIPKPGHASGNNSKALNETFRWLVSAQEPSGRWNPVSWGGNKEYTLALNGLALLTFAKAPEAAMENVTVIDRAVKYIVSCQKENGLFGDEVEGMMYNHGIVTVALLETYAVKRDSSLKTSIDKALDFIKKQQLITGGWGYANSAGETANTSIAIWQLQALLLSSKLGWKDQVPCLHKGLLWLGSMIDDKGQFGYDRPQHSPEGSETLTAMGALCMFMASEEITLQNKNMLLKLKKTLVSLKQENSSNDFYRCYFQAAAFQAAKTAEYDRMLAGLQRSLITVQEQSGGNAGSWSPRDKWGSVGGRIYSTAVAALTLELGPGKSKLQLYE